MKINKFTIFIVSIFVISLIKALFFSHIGLNLIFDDNQQYLSARSINEGGLIYRDFQSFFPPGSDYHVSVFLTFTQNIIHLRYLHSLIFAFFPVLIFWLNYQVTKKVSISFVPSLLLIFIPNRPDKYFLHAFLALTLVFFYRYLKDKHPKYLIISGAIISITILFRYDFSLYLLSSYVIVILLSNNKLKSNLKELIRLLVFPLFGLLAFLYFIFKNSIATLAYKQIVIVPLTASAKLKTNLLFPLNELGKSDSIVVIANILLESILYWIFISILVCSLIIIRKGHLKKHDKYFSITLVLSCVFALPYMLGNMDSGHLLKTGYPIVLLLAICMNSLRSELSKNIGLIFLSLLVLLFTMRSIFWVNFNNQIVDFSEKGKFYMNSSFVDGTSRVSADTYKKAVEFLKISDNEYVFAAPYMSSLYYFSDKRPPTIYENLLGGYTFEPYGEEYIIDQICTKKVERVVYDPERGRMAKLGGMKMIYPQVHDFITRNYMTVYESREGWLFMIEKEQLE